MIRGNEYPWLQGLKNTLNGKNTNFGGKRNQKFQWQNTTEGALIMALKRHLSLEGMIGPLGGKKGMKRHKEKTDFNCHFVLTSR